jgi:hypothetical protein
MTLKQQQRNGVFCLARADVCARSNGKRQATAKQQLHCNRNGVFYTVLAELLSSGQLVGRKSVSGVSEEGWLVGE